MKNIAKIAALSAVLSVGNIEAKNIERTDVLRNVSTERQNLAKNILMENTRTDVLQNVSTTADFTKSREKLDTETEPTPAEKAQAKELVETLFELADYEAMGEYLAKNGDSLSEVVLNEALKVVKDKISVAGDNANFARKEAGHYKSVVKSNSAYQKIPEASIKHEKEYMAEVSHLSSVRSSIKDLLEKKSIPTAEDFIGKPSTIDQKSREIVEWEKKYEMEIVLGTGEDEGYIDVYHNGEIVSSLGLPGSYKGKPTLSLTKDGKMVFIYADKEKDDNIIIYIPENGGMTEKTETSGTSQLYKFTKTTVAQN